MTGLSEVLEEGRNARRSLYSVCVIGAAALISIVIGTVLNYGFISGLSGDLVTARGDDGFGVQLALIGRMIADGSLLASIAQEPLFLIHLIRYAVAQPFILAERTFGPAAPLAMLCVVVLPLCFQFAPAGFGWKAVVMWTARAGVMFAPLVLSGRTVLVAAGAGYIVASLFKRQAIWWIGLGVALISFSSAAVMLCLLLLLVSFIPPRWPRSTSLARAIGIGLLLCLLVPSVGNKLPGFQHGGAGYQTVDEVAAVVAARKPSGKAVSPPAAATATPAVSPPAAATATPKANPQPTKPVQSGPVVKKTLFQTIGIDNLAAEPLQIIDRVLTRSTLYTSFAYGQKNRLILYAGLVLAVIFAIGIDIMRGRAHVLIVPIVILLLGLLLEGLGSWTVLWPLVWRYTGSDEGFGYAISETHQRPLEVPEG